MASVEVRNKGKVITNNTAKIQLKIFGRTFRLTSGAIVNAKKLTLCWVLSHDAKKGGNRDRAWRSASRSRVK